MSREAPAFQKTSVREELFNSLMAMNPLEKPVEYIDVLDHYELEVLRETQEKRKVAFFKKLGIEES